MRWPPWRRPTVPGGEADHAKREASRALVDAQNFDRRAEAAAVRFEHTKRRNHIAEAIEIAIKPRRAAE